MRQKTPKIKKANVIHSVFLRTLPTKKALQYCLSLFISGIFFLIVSLRASSITIKTTLQIFSSFLIIISIYVFPFFEIEKIDNFFHKFILYMGLLLVFIIYTLFWCALCLVDTSDIRILLFIIPTSIIEVLLTLYCVNYTLKPIINIISNISSEIRKKAENNDNKDNKLLTYIKTFCANVSIIISFILTVITLLTTFSNIFKPFEIIEKLISP